MRRIFLTMAFFSALGCSKPTPIQFVSNVVPTPDAPAATVALNFDLIDHIGDSRTSAIYIGGIRQNGLGAGHWINQANALFGQRYPLNLNLGISGNRSDQYLTTNFAQALASPAGWLLVGFPTVNDLGQSGGAGYTNTFGPNNGVAVTTANVAEIAASNIIFAATKALAAGKKVILTEEPGATGLSPAQVTALYDFNLRLRAYAASTAGVYIWSANPVLWSPTASATNIAFRTNYTMDGTHYSSLGSIAAAQAFHQFAQGFFPAWDQQIGNITDITTDPRELVRNPLFTVLTGGSTSGCGTITGTIPSGWNLGCGSASTNITITSAANAGGFGSDITLAITTTTADSVSFQPYAPANASWNITDYFVGSAGVTVNSGSSNATVNLDVQSLTDQGGQDNWGLYPNPYGPGPTTAYTYQLRTLPGQVVPNSTTKSYIALYTIVNFSAAGSATVTWSRVSLRRVYNFGGGVFSGN